MSEYFCRVCGLKQIEPIWGENNNIPTYEICDCCGVEFGNEDYTIESIIKYRNKWIVNGFNWFNPKAKPNGWSLESQIKNVLQKYKEN